MAAQISRDIFLPVDTNLLATNVKTRSAFLSALGASARTDLPTAGLRGVSFEHGDLAFVAEGEEKPSNQGEFIEITALLAKLANQQIFTQETIDSAGALWDAIYTTASNKVGQAIDKLTATTGAVDGGVQLTDGLGDATAYPVSSLSGFNAAITAISGAGGVRPTAIVASTAALFNLRDVLLFGSDNRFTNLQGLQNASVDNPGEIDGMKIYVFESADPTQLFVGDFLGSAIGGIEINYPRVKKLIEYASINGVGVALGSDNKVALLTEVRFAFRVASKARFGKIVVTAPVVAPEEEEG